MNLSKTQKRAIRLAATNGGLVDTFQVAGSTGNSLYKRGLVYRHFIDADYGTTITYELSDAGWRVANDMQATAPQPDAGDGDGENGGE